MKIQAEPNDPVIVALKAIQDDINKPDDNVEERLDTLAYNLVMLIDVLINEAVSK